MAYDKQNFKSGNKLYAKQLNAMDDKVADNDDRLDAYAQFDVQGTSSAGYARKNYKGKFKGGFVQNGEQIAKYSMREGCTVILQ